MRPLPLVGLLLLMGGCASGRRIEHVEDVQVEPNSTTFYHRFEQERRALPTASVRIVQIRGETGSGRSFLIGAAPGVVITFIGGAVAITYSGEDSVGSGIAVALGRAMAAGGVVIGLLGGTVGAIVGGDPERGRVDYDLRGPRHEVPTRTMRSGRLGTGPLRPISA